MSFSRGKYGVEYTLRRPEEKSGGLRWILVLVGVLLVASFILTRLLSRQKPARIDVESRPPSPSAEPAGGTDRVATESASAPSAPAPRPPETAPAPKPPRPPQPAPDPQATRDATKLLDTAHQRPAAERVLEGCRIDTIKRLCDRPAVADLHPRLWERLGQLNMQLLLSDRSSPWTARVTVKRGDSRDRLARDNHTTSAALDRLNPDTNWTSIRPGDVIRVLQNPRAVLVIHKGLGFADLSLKGAFFHRYSFTGGARATAGVYPVSREPGKTAHAYLRDLGVTFSQKDRSDLEMFLAPESSITVSDQ